QDEEVIADGAEELVALVEPGRAELVVRGHQVRYWATTTRRALASSLRSREAFSITRVPLTVWREAASMACIASEICPTPSACCCVAVRMCSAARADCAIESASCSSRSPA